MIELTAVFTLLTADPIVPDEQVEKLKYIIVGVAILISFISPGLRTTLWGWIWTGFKKAVKDESIAEENKKIISEIKKAIEMIQNVQAEQRQTQTDLKSLAGQNLDILKRLEKVDTKEDEQDKIISRLRERVAKLEGKLE